MKKKRKKFPHPEAPKLKFSPTAWAKLLFLRDYGETEVGGFGICPNHPLIVEDIGLVNQTCSWASVSFHDDSVADFFEIQVANGLVPEQFARVWIHTHPGESADPSCVDERTFSRVFGKTNWAVMAILARDGETYGRLRLNGNPIQDSLMDVEVDFNTAFAGSQFEAWESEYLENVFEEDLLTSDIWTPYGESFWSSEKAFLSELDLLGQEEAGYDIFEDAI